MQNEQPNPKGPITPGTTKYASVDELLLAMDTSPAVVQQLHRLKSAGDYGTHSILVQRHGEPGTAVLFECVTKDECSNEEVLQRVRKGVTRWVAETPEGAEAWAGSSHDLNIGDVLLHEADVLPFLEQEGLLGVAFEQLVFETCSWHFDTHLVDAAA
jgi:hypothetical protein